MITAICNWFVKITGWIPQLLIFRIKVYYKNKKVQGKKIKGNAIIASNHFSLFDFAALMFVFWRRTLRCVVAEIMYRKNIFMTTLLKALGSVKADREALDFTFIGRCKKILDKGGVVEIFPESRLPTPEDKGELLEFKPSVVYLALESGAPIIPVYTNGKYFTKERTRVIIGEPIIASELYDESISNKENISNITLYLRGKIIELRDELQRQLDKENS